MATKSIILCCDTAVHQARLSARLSADYDTVRACKFSQLEEVVVETTAPVMVVCWQYPCAELNHIISLSCRKKLPLLVMVERLNPSNINRLPQNSGYVLLSMAAEPDLAVWVEHAKSVREHQDKLEGQIFSLQEKLTERRYIDKAKGLLMKLHKLDEDSAYKALRSAAMNNSVSVGQVAKNLMATLQDVG